MHAIFELLIYISSNNHEDTNTLNPPNQKYFKRISHWEN